MIPTSPFPIFSALLVAALLLALIALLFVLVPYIYRYVFCTSRLLFCTDDSPIGTRQLKPDPFTGDAVHPTLLRPFAAKAHSTQWIM